MSLVRTRSLESMLSWYYGPYRIRGKSTFRIDSSLPEHSKSVEYPFYIQNPLELSGSTIDLSGSMLAIALAPGSTLERRKSFWKWESVFDARFAQQGQKLQFDLPKEGLYRIRTASESFTFGLSEDLEPWRASLLPSVRTIREDSKWIGRILLAAALHALLFYIVLYTDWSWLNFSWLSEGEDMQPETAEVVTVEELATVLSQAQEALDGEFSGKGLSVYDTSLGKARIESESKRIGDNLAQLARVMKNMNLSGLSSKNVNKSRKQVQVGSGAARAGAAGLGSGKKTGLGKLFRLSNGGSVSASMSLPSSNKGGFSLSAKDQELLLRLFIAKQDAVRDCYERSLLKDESLEVNAGIDALVRSSGRMQARKVALSGNGSRGAKAQLQACVSQVVGTISAPNRLSGIAVTYNYLLSK